MHLRHHTMPTSKIIDLALGMKRLHTTEESKAIEALRILCETLKKDMLILHDAQQKNNLEAARVILMTIQHGLRFSGTPRLETACKMLYEKVKCAQDLSKLFALVYDEANLFTKKYQELIKN